MGAMSGPVWSVSGLCCVLAALLVTEVRAFNTTRFNGGGAQCGEYSNQLMENGMCRIVATLPQQEGHTCPDMFRCTDEVSFWLHENEELQRRLAALRATVSEMQEELRSHRHHVKVLELQAEERTHLNLSLEHRLHDLEMRYTEATSLLHIQGTLILDLQNQVHNLTEAVVSLRRTPGCLHDVLHPNSLMSSPESSQHSETPHLRSCPIDCASVYYNGERRSGLYAVIPLRAGLPLQVYCDMDTDGGGWTVIQRRIDGAVSFDRTWGDYRDGFGDLRSEFWLGNDHIHDLSAQGEYTLRIDLEDWSNKHKHAIYQSFSVEDEEHQYRLHVSGFSGSAQDSFAWYHDKQSFSTPDSGSICAEISHGGWWYNQCFYAHLNGVYYRGGHYSPRGRAPLGPDGIVWHSWKDSDYYSLRKVTMMIRPRSFRRRVSP